MKQGMYIVVSENEIVKAERKKPDEPGDQDYSFAALYDMRQIVKWKSYCLSLPRIPIQGKHNWKVWQEVVEGRDVEFDLIDNRGWQGQWVAIPIEQTKSEQGEKNVREDIAKILRDNIHFSGQTGDFIIHGAIEKIIEYFGQQGAEEWISVKYRLPDESGRYWCYCEHIGDLGKSYFQWNCAYDPYSKTFSDDSFNDGEQVTHWRKLPPPPIK